MRSKQNLFNTIVIGGLLVIAGCTMTQNGGAGAKHEIATMKFTLPRPEQIAWQQVKNQSKNGNMLSEWVPKGNTPANTPVRVIYQRLTPAMATNDFVGRVIQPIQKLCSDHKVAAFKGTSTYPDQANAEMICARLGKNSFGTITYLSVFTDQSANHMLVSEVKAPASEKAGVLNFKTDREKQMAQNSAALAKLMYELNYSVKVCDAKNRCQ